MNVTMVCFSQTGNTRRVAEAMAAAFRAAGHTPQIVSLKEATPQHATTGNLLGIGTPCLSSQAPTPMKAFLRSLPQLDGRRAFVFATSGGAPGRVSYDLTRLLRDRGAEVVGGFLTRGEVHHPAPCLTGRMAGRPNEEDLADARGFAAAVAEHVSSGRAGPVDIGRPDAFRPGRGFYDLVAAISTDGFLRFMLPEPETDPARCNQCGWCVRQCPTQNIVLEPHPVLADRCIRCYRCTTGCPQEALTTDWRWGNLAVWAFYNTALERWFGDLKPGERIY